MRDADILQYYLEQQPGVMKVRVYERTNDASICYTGERKELLKALASYSQKMVTVPEDILEHSGRALNARYKEKLIGKLVFRAVEKLIIPLPVRNCLVCCRSLKYLHQDFPACAGAGWRCRYWTQQPLARLLPEETSVRPVR